MQHNWHYAKGGDRRGPITAAQLKELATTGQLAPDDLVWREDMKEWRKASTVKGLFSQNAGQTTAKTPPPLPHAVSSSESKSVTPKKFLWGCLLFPVMIALLLPAVQRARDTARKAQAERQANGVNVDKVAGPSSVEKVDESLLNLGNFHNLGEAFFDNLPFARLEEKPTAKPMPLSSEFFRAGGFRFRERSMFDDGSPNSVREWSEYLDFRPSPQDGEILQQRKHPFKVDFDKSSYSDSYGVYPLNAMPGDNWKWSGEVSVRYVRSVKLGGHDCVVLYYGTSLKDYRKFFADNPRSLAVPDPDDPKFTIEAHRTEEWWVRGVGLVRRDVYMLGGPNADVLTLLTQAFLVDPVE